ncbi:MAG: L-fucose/L-arabinose isomerase family protein [Anaerolineaceae bacterium]|nr:L-fucose/L-arabinose isomerase family protein [Anaerolineaceae bacterium]
MPKTKTTTLALIIGTRDFFPADPVRQGRDEVIRLLTDLNVDAITLSEEETRFGAVETWEQVKKCADLFQRNRSRIDGILVILPVFGPEKAVADTIRLSELNVPVLVQAYPDDMSKLQVELRRDAFCGKFSVCNNLYQYGIPFTLTEKHTVSPTSESFKRDLEKFVGVCRVVKGMRHARIGAIGARPSIFNTVRYSEKLLEAAGITVNTADLSEIFGDANRIAEGSPQVKERLEGIQAYVNTQGVPSPALVRMARLGVALDEWVAVNEVDAISFQCWTSIQKNYGVNACTLMSMWSESLLPSACEVDTTGALSMYALQLASEKPSALVDWNNNYSDEDDKAVLFHCGNWARSYFDEVKMANAEILATVLGTDNTYGTISGLAKSSPLTYARLTTDDRRGRIRTYVGEGQITNDPLDTFGSRAVAEIPHLHKLTHFICKNGFEHHAAINPSHVAGILEEAFTTYLGWDVYHHPGCECGCTG